jgi:hypothetical protein
MRSDLITVLKMGALRTAWAGTATTSSAPFGRRYSMASHRRQVERRRSAGFGEELTGKRGQTLVIGRGAGGDDDGGMRTSGRQFHDLVNDILVESPRQLRSAGSLIGLRRDLERTAVMKLTMWLAPSSLQSRSLSAPVSIVMTS